MIAMSTVSSDAAYQSRLPLKLGLLFLATFLVIVVGGLVMDIFAGLYESQKARSDASVQQPGIVIDPKLETELAKVKNFENTQNLADLKDPFLDRTGISQNGNITGISTTRSTTPTSSGSSGQSNSGKVAGSTTKVSPNPQGGGNPSTTVPGNVVVVKEDTGVRIKIRDDNIRNGIPVGPESEVFAIEDLLPVGVVTGGSGQDEILLYSQTADRTYSFPVGTRFFDGWLTEIKPEGGVFGFNETREIRLKSWVRSIQPRSSGN